MNDVRKMGRVTIPTDMDKCKKKCDVVQRLS